VLFDGVAAPVVYASAGQVNVVTPYSVANGLSTVEIKTAGGSVSSATVGAATTAPGIFPGAIVNANGTINSPSNPAPVGSYVVMYGTGFGQTSPGGVDGSITPVVDYPKQIYQVFASVDRNPLFATAVPMNVFYYGPAPGLAEGVGQIDAYVPAGVASGENFIALTVGPNVSPAIFFYVQ
jgi:uncharacterized protein (TIGR03437 family)